METTRDEELQQSRRALPKNIMCPLPYRIAKASGSEDLLSHLSVHAGARDEIDYGGGASHERQNLDWFQVCAAVAGQEFI
jgi:hypothetical protein